MESTYNKAPSRKELSMKLVDVIWDLGSMQQVAAEKYSKGTLENLRSIRRLADAMIEDQMFALGAETGRNSDEAKRGKGIDYQKFLDSTMGSVLDAIIGDGTDLKLREVVQLSMQKAYEYGFEDGIHCK